jgi:hypothetical protein
MRYFSSVGQLGVLAIGHDFQNMDQGENVHMWFEWSLRSLANDFAYVVFGLLGFSTG